MSDPPTPTAAASATPGSVAPQDDDIEDIIDKLDEHNIQPDREIGEDDAQEENGQDPAAVVEDQEDIKDKEEEPNGTDTPEPAPETHTNSVQVSQDKTKSSSTKSESGESEKKLKNPFKFLKRLSSGGSKAEKEKEERLKRKEKLEKVLHGVKVETLPQTFVTKYLGNQPSRGLYGIKFTREPVEALVSEISNSKKGTDLPLFSVQVSTRGLLISPHRANKSNSIPIDMGLLPIEFISYGVQDIKYTRIFSYIVVREMSSKSKTLECHALLCDSVVTARRLALAMALAFKEYARTLQGKPYKFKVDLRAPGEVEKDLQEVEDSEEVDEEDCEA